MRDYYKIRSQDNSGYKFGVNACYGSDDDGRIHGVSAFHVLSGYDNSVDEYDKVETYDEFATIWLDAGLGARGVYYNQSPYGLIKVDAGCYELSKDFYRSIHPNLLRMNPSRYLYPDQQHLLVGLRVYSYSVMNDSYISGKIVTQFKNGYDFYIEYDPGSTTKKGDSGLMWFDGNGDPVGMHVWGNGNEATGVDSTESGTTSLNRILYDLQLKWLYTLPMKHPHLRNRGVPTFSNADSPTSDNFDLDSEEAS